MNFSTTLSRYLAKQYLINLLLLIFMFLAIFYLFDTGELLRRASKKEDVPFSLILQMGFFKLFDAAQVTFPFAVLISAMFTFWQLTRRQELIVVRSAGFSVWQFLAPVLAIALGFGLFNITVLNPAGSVFLSKFETLENEYLANRKSYITLLKEGLWLRQIQDNDKGHVILHADHINLDKWALQDVMVLFFGENDEFLRRIDAKKARLDDGMWQFESTINNYAGQRHPEKLPLVALPTDLTVKELEESFASPGTLSFWQLPGFIKTMEATGFDSTPMRIHLQSLLAQPLLFAAMILLAAAVSIRPPRFSGTMFLIATGVAIGFTIFFFQSFLQALGASHQIPAFLAAWTPAMVSFLLGIAIMLSLEDG